MGDNESDPKHAPQRPLFRRQEAGTRYSFLAEEKQILEQIVLGAPLPQTLNRLCAIIDDGIVNVVAMISLPDDEESHIYVNAQTAIQVGLKVFSSTAILSRDNVLLGTLEIYGCDSRLPTSNETELVERVAHLAAVALQRHKDMEVREKGSKHSSRIIDGRANEKAPFIN
jgi:hypothetical protein